MTLRNQSTPDALSLTRLGQRGNDQAKGEQRGTIKEGANKKPSVKAMRCYNCGERDHVSVNCPTKDQGAKCFKCGEREHVASKCSIRPKVSTESCAISGISCHKYFKNIYLASYIP